MSLSLLQVGIDVASHVQSFLSKADLGVRMTGSEGSVLEEVTLLIRQQTRAQRQSRHEVMKLECFDFRL